MSGTISPIRDWEIYTRNCNGETVSSIAKDYNLSRERVRQICFEQNALNRQKFADSVNYGRPRESELYKWIMIRVYPKPCDSSIRVRAYNAVRLAWNRSHENTGIPTVEYLISFDNASIRKLRGVGPTTAQFLISVRDAILEDRAKRDESLVHLTGHITYVGSDGNVYLRSSVSMETALSRLYAYENSGLGPAAVKDYRRELDKREGLGTQLAPLQIQELRGILVNEGLYVEYKDQPELNGWMLWKNRPEWMTINDYMVKWRAWPYEPTPEARLEAEWRECTDERIRA